MKNTEKNVGSYAISTVSFNSWVNEPIKKDKKTKKKVDTKEIVNKIFAEYAAIITDPFWVEKLNNASLGKFPQKFSYNNNTLIYKKGSKSYTLELTNNPFESAYKCIEFFRAHGGIFSPIDEQNSMDIQLSLVNNNEEKLTWGNSNKKIKDFMLSNYIGDLKEIMKLNHEQIRQLDQTLKQGISNKYFGKHNIYVENNRIQSIEGLLYENNNFYIDPNLKPISTRVYTRKKNGPPVINTNQKDMYPQFNVKWNKYIDTLDKKLDKNKKAQNKVNINIVDNHSSTDDTYILSAKSDNNNDNNDDDDEE